MATKLHQFFASQGDALYELANNGEFQLAQFLANHTGIGWTSLAHTSDFVPIVARGPGAERFRGFIQNVDVFPHYTQFAGVDHQNPTLPCKPRRRSERCLLNQAARMCSFPEMSPRLQPSAPDATERHGTKASFWRAFRSPLFHPPRSPSVNPGEVIRR